MCGSQGNPRRLVFLLALLGLLPAFPAVGATTWFVDGATSPSADGLTWATPKSTIQEAVDAASDGDQIWVAEGVYSEHVDLRSGLSLYGGFSKTEATVDDRDLAHHRTILDGTGRTDDEILRGGDISGFLIDGLNIQNAPGSAVYIDGSWSGLGGAIRNCGFLGNGDKAVVIYSVSCAIQNCSFENNAGYAALYLLGTDYNSYLIHNCIFMNNGGAGLSAAGVNIGPLIIYADISIDQCVAVGNKGNGIAVGDAEARITNCLTAGNSLGIWCQGVSISVTNCTVAQNAAGGIYCIADWTWEIPPYTPSGLSPARPVMPTMPVYSPVPSDLSVTNCILSENDPNGVYFDSYSALTPTRNLFHGNAYAVQTYQHDFPAAADVNAAFEGARDNLDGDPAFVNQAAGDCHLWRRSAAIDRGTAEGLEVDLDGAPRPVDTYGIGADGTGTEFDIGAYEYQDRVVYSPMSGQVCREEAPILWVEPRLVGAEVAISLWRDNQWVREIAASTANDGEYLWPIPAGVEPGGGYKVGVASTEDPGTLDFSGVFSIVAPPTLVDAWDDGGGKVGLAWADDSPTTLSCYLSFAYDLYSAQFVPRGWAGTMWFRFPPTAHSGQMDVGQSGAYFAWISTQWTDGTWSPGLNPKALVVYSGTPHTPAGASVQDRGAGVWRLHWAPEIFGTWLVQIIVFQNGVGWIAPTDGPSSAFPQFSPWAFVDYGCSLYNPAKASFLNGWADLTLPEDGSYVFCLNFKSWDGATQGAFATVPAN